MTFHKALATTLAVAATTCFAISDRLMAQTSLAATAPIITYTAAGTFASTPVSGSDTLKLAGEPFSVTIAVSSSTKPTTTGKNWALYTKLKLTGTVHSGLLGTTPVNIASGGASIQQFATAGQPDLFVMGAPIKVVGVSLTIKSNITLPANTLTKPLLHPFSSVTLAPATATLSYSDGTNTTELAIQTGTLAATIPAAAPTTVLLHSAAVQATTLHADGTESTTAVKGPVDLGQLSDVVTLKFYASGVSNASQVSMQIAGEQVPVLYAGPSGHYAGLDQVFVQLPRSLAGRGPSDALLTVDGQTASPVSIHLQ
jgi:hypothetical protein